MYMKGDFFFTIKYKFVITVAQIQETKKIQ